MHLETCETLGPDLQFVLAAVHPIAGTRHMERDAQDAPIVIATLVHDPDGDRGRLLSVQARSPSGALEPAPTRPVISSTGGEDIVRISVDAVDFQDEETTRAQTVVSSQGTVCKSATCNAPIAKGILFLQACSINTYTVTVLIRSSPGVHPAHVHVKNELVLLFPLSGVCITTGTDPSISFIFERQIWHATASDLDAVDNGAEGEGYICPICLHEVCARSREHVRARASMLSHTHTEPSWRHACIFLCVHHTHVSCVVDHTHVKTASKQAK